MEKNDLKEKMIVIGATMGLFLPVRLFLSTQISDDWIGSLGIMSAIAIVFVVLIKRKRYNNWLTMGDSKILIEINFP